MQSKLGPVYGARSSGGAVSGTGVAGVTRRTSDRSRHSAAGPR